MICSPSSVTVHLGVHHVDDVEARKTQIPGEVRSFVVAVRLPIIML